MSYFLLIETSTTICSVALSRDAEIIALKEINNGYAHAEHLTLFCESVLKEAGIVFSQLHAVGVSKGPGSYTGLRIGLSAAKGFCFGLDIPLIAIGTLQSMAAGLRTAAQPDQLLCPMIDARRMEVYTAIYDQQLRETEAPNAKIIDAGSIALLPEQALLYGGDGMPKCRELLAQRSGSAFSDEALPSAKYLAPLVYARFLQNDFDDLAYCEPFYLKNFTAGKPKQQ